MSGSKDFLKEMRVNAEFILEVVESFLIWMRLVLITLFPKWDWRHWASTKENNIVLAGNVVYFLCLSSLCVKSVITEIKVILLVWITGVHAVFGKLLGQIISIMLFGIASLRTTYYKFISH